MNTLTLPPHIQTLIRKVDTGALDHDLTLTPHTRIHDTNAYVRSYAIAYLLGDPDALKHLQAIHDALQ